MLILGGVHGDEFEPMAAVRRLMKLIEPSDLRGRVTLVPVVNEAAFLRKHRFAGDGLDLARTCPGRADGSVTQRRAHAISAMITAGDFLIDLHTGGTTLTVWPFAGYCLHSNEQVLAVQRRMGRAFNLPLVWSTASRNKGRTLSVARDTDIPAIYAEYMGGGRCDRAGVEAYSEGCLNVLAELDMIDRPRWQDRVQYVVEDERENSAFMQIQNPTPMAGYFEPAVTLGQSIAVGEPIGSVCDVLGKRTVTIESKQSGIVVVLKTFSRVDKDDSVAVIVEVDRPLGGFST